MKGLLFFLGGLSATAIFIAAAVLAFRKATRRFSRRYFGTVDFSGLLREISVNEEKPKSLSGMDSVYLPQILKDFPDFNPTLAETYVKEQLRNTCAQKQDFRIHNVVIHSYERTQAEKTIVYQAALEYREAGRLQQKRFCLRYAYLLPQDGKTAAANCPNCGAPLSEFSQRVCEYCGSRLVNIMGNTWRFTEVFEK